MEPGGIRSLKVDELAKAISVLFNRFERRLGQIEDGFRVIKSGAGRHRIVKNRRYIPLYLR